MTKTENTIGNCFFGHFLNVQGYFHWLSPIPFMDTILGRCMQMLPSKKQSEPICLVMCIIQETGVQLRTNPPLSPFWKGGQKFISKKNLLNLQLKVRADLWFQEIKKWQL